MHRPFLLWYQDCTLLWLVNSLCKIFVSIFVFKWPFTRFSFTLLVCLILIISGGLTIFPSSPFQSSTERKPQRSTRSFCGCWRAPPCSGWGAPGPRRLPRSFLLPPSLSLLGSGLFQVQKSTKLPHRKVGPGRSQVCSCPEPNCQDRPLDYPKLKFSLSRTFPGF